MVLVFVMYGAICVWVWRESYARERRFMAKCESRGGRCTFRFYGPNWVPMWLERRLQFCNRIDYVVAGPRSLPADFMSDVRSLATVVSLDLDETNLNDSDMIHLEKLTRLRTLRLDRTELTDAGLEHLKSLRELQTIGLFATQTTPEGRESLRKALPKCEITPDP